MTGRGAGADIELVGVERTFGPVRALAGVDLTIPAGFSTVVMGGNGAGKTTLLRVVAGLASPTAGTVRVGGVDRRRAGARLRALVGFAGHDSLLYRELTVRENLAFHAALHDLPASVVDDAATRFDLVAVLDRPAGAVSRGTRQRASLARALLHDPAVVLLDEPFTGLDLEGADRLAEQLDDLRRRGRTIVFTVHDASRATLAERLVVMADGRIVADGPADDAREVAAAVRAAGRRGPSHPAGSALLAPGHREVGR